MLVPLSWLREYVHIDATVEDVAHRLTMAGLEVESVERTGGTWEQVVVGLVKAVNPHPNADRLRLVTVDTGREEVEVVCGAPNVAEGQKIAYAAVGANLIDGHTGKPTTLKPAKIRGVVSQGMVCSERELGLSGQHEGILVLDPSSPTGRPLADVLGDTVLNIKVTPNRPDCLGILGVARELAALTGSRATPPDVTYQQARTPVTSRATVRIEATDLCARYTATVITGVKVGPSPDWLVQRLKLIGQHAINNVVDITNYVMFEFGQPLHAFNLGEVRGNTVIVRRAQAGEKLTTLDGIERTLTPDIQVIADAERPLGIAGVIGGLRSGIHESTTDILLESATFAASNNRRTQAALGIKTEATLRFEKGLRPELAEVALRRATRLIKEICGGEVAAGVIDEWPNRRAHDPTVPVTAARLTQVLGITFPEAQILATLQSLGCELGPYQGGWRVTPPYWRADITLAEDVAEELARVIGYESIPTTAISGVPPRWEPNPARDLRERLRDALVAEGMQEIVTYPLSTEESLASAGAPASPRPLRLANPMSADHAVLRTTLREAVLRVGMRNTRTWRGPVAMFECARVYFDGGEGLPDERDMCAGVLAGPANPPHWSGEGAQFGFYEARGVVESLFERLDLTPAFVAVDEPAFASGRCAAIAVGKKRIGFVGEVARSTVAAFDGEVTPVALFEIDLTTLASLAGSGAPPHVQYQPFGRFPESVRDLSVVVDAKVPAARLLEIASRSKLVVDVTVFDVYRGKGLPEGTRAIGLRMVYQSPERTLTSEEIDRAHDGILKGLQKEFDARSRA
ncbi:MAG: phenylalanine--tRNA ligase subunit beta [SAR202 cluster bacterium]|nr:phenylalanine--tRNA ligase subunit beta [SAR202 cluster bacterium]